MSVRLEQQKKFYEEEREQRRLKELELLKQKKMIQDSLGALRQKEQLLAQQKKLYEDDVGRAKQKEQLLLHRIEQLQRDWRASASKLDQTQRDLMQQKKVLQGEQTRATLAQQEMARVAAFNERAAESRLKASQAQNAPAAGTLSSLEQEAQRELGVWQKNTEEPASQDQPDKADPAGPPPSRSLFRPRPWMKLK
jgi:hypothetical protein